MIGSALGILVNAYIGDKNIRNSNYGVFLITLWLVKYCDVIDYLFEIIHYNLNVLARCWFSFAYSCFISSVLILIF